jgi:hypothetical protein
MFQIFENAWTKLELAWFYQDMQKAKHSIEKQNSSDPNYRDPDSLRWKCEKGTDARNRLQEKISQLLPDHQIDFAAYVEQYKPNKLHCDSYGGPVGVTGIIPLLEYNGDTDQTLVFDHLSTEATNTESILIRLRQSTKNCATKFRHTHNYNLNHCGYESVINATALMGVFPYRQGDMAAFDKRLLHCSNNWTATDPKRKHKDFIIIHTLKNN